MSEQEDRGVVDMSKLTQRELLILLTQKVNIMSEDMKGIKSLEKRVSKLETKQVVISAVTAAASIIIGYFLNILRIIYDR